MVVIQKAQALIKNVFNIVVGFFTKTDKATREELKGMDVIEIFMALLPVAVFGSLIFGIRALITISLCVAVCFLTSLLWDVIFKTGKKPFDYQILLTGFILGLSLNNGINIAFTVAISIFTVVLAKTVFRNNPKYLCFSVLLAKAIFTIFFYKAFSLYTLPFATNEVIASPVNSMFESVSHGFSVKSLFFGLHSGNIGATSDFLLIVGAMYLMLRKIINPIISVGYILTVAVLSIAFDYSLPTALIGGSLFFTALYLTMDYGFESVPLYKRILYGICCGALTFLMRVFLKTEGATMAVIVSNVLFIYLNQRNIKRAVKFFKKPDFRKLLNKLTGF